MPRHVRHTVDICLLNYVFEYLGLGKVIGVQVQGKYADNESGTWLKTKTYQLVILI